jgi:hypothetical protein
LSASSERRIVGITIAAVLGTAWVGCSFPEHTFIEDSEFYGTGAGGVGAAGSAGASGGGAGGTGGGGTAGGGTAGGGTSGGGTAGGAATGGGGTGGGGPEDCLNGVDDDGDGKIDCDDPDCQSGHTCVPIAPATWAGPLVFYKGSGAAPECLATGEYKTVAHNGNSGLNLGTASCPSCACDSPNGTVCSVDLVFFTSATCGSGSCWGYGPQVGCGDPGSPTPAITKTAGACSFLPTLLSNDGSGARGAAFTNVQVTGGACNSSSSGTKNIPAPSWDETVRVCGGAPNTGKGCGASVCLPRPQSPFQSKICIAKDGDNPCPSGPFSDKLVFHKSFTDNRDCSTCGCGLVSGGTCNATIELFTDDFCASNKDTLNVQNQCVGITIDPDPEPNPPPPSVGPADTRSAIVTGTPSGGSCTISGGQITGAATPAQPVTLCCM